MAASDRTCWQTIFMGRFVALLFLVLGLVCALGSPHVAQAEEGVAPAEPQVAASSWARPLLFEVRAPDGEGSITLLGTFHVGIALEDAPAVLVERFEASRTYVMEVDLVDATATAAQYMTLPDGGSLREALGEELWRELERRLPGASLYERQRPWLVGTLLVMQMLPQGHATAGMDAALLARAREAGYALEYLETSELQFEVLDAVMDLEALEEMLRDWDTEVARLDALRVAFLAGDLAALEAAVLHEDFEEADRVKLLDARNEAWIPHLERLVARGDAFVAFGAAHLVGEHGVLELLRDKGYTIERVD